MAESKIHYASPNHFPPCGTGGRRTLEKSQVTCRRCKFHILANVAPWAREFLDDLRKVSFQNELQLVLGDMVLGARGPLDAEQQADVNAFYSRMRELHMETATGEMLDFLCRIPTRPPGISDAALRELARGGKLDSIRVPAGTAEPMDGKVKGLGNGFTRAFGQQCDPEKAVRELLSGTATLDGPIQPVMNDGGAPANAVGVQERQISEQPGNASQIGYKPGRDHQFPE